MKIQTKLVLLSSATVLAASPLALANKGAHADAAVEESANTECFVGVDPGIDPTPEVVVEEAVDHCQSADEVETPDAPIEDTTHEGTDVDDATPVEDVANEDSAVPIDWVKRGGGDNPDVMFYNMAGGGTPVFKGETSSVSKEPGQNERGSAIETREMGMVPQINREKKGPVALLKKGRVFLR